MASVTFMPNGSQLDRNAIAVLATDLGDRNNFSSRDGDFARITNFNFKKDRILLFDFAEQYTLYFLPSNNDNINAKLVYNSGLDSSSELIALIENVNSDLSIGSSAFTFV